MLQRWDAVNTWWNDRVVKFNYDDQLRLLQRLGFSSPGARELGWAFGSGLVGWLLWIAWHTGRGGTRTRPDGLARAYIALCKKLERAGVPREAHQGPLAFASAISRHRPDLHTVQTLLESYIELRYGRPEKHAPTRIRDFQRAVRRLTVGAHA
jgi:hypothetical protein